MAGENLGIVGVGTTSGGGAAPTPRDLFQQPTTVLKVYTPFGPDDVVKNLARSVSEGMWIGNTGRMEKFYTYFSK